MRFGLLMAAVGACLLIAGVAKAAESNVYWRADLHQGSYIIAYGEGVSADAALQDCYRLAGITRAMTAAETRKGAVSAVTTQAVRYCNNERRYSTVRPDPVVPPPVNCVVSDWGAWSDPAWLACSGGQQTRALVRTRTIVTQPANGGVACPALVETQTETRPCPTTCPPAPAPQTKQTVCGVGYTGTYTEVSSSIVAPDCTVITTWTPVPPGASACVPQSQPPTAALFHDSFEYDVSRAATNADVLFGQRGWAGVKAVNSAAARGNGWVYTRVDATIGSRVLVLESNPGSTPMAGMPYSQTDYYLQLGREGSTAQVLPANVWIQFATYATPTSRFSTRDKTIYPCSGFYACSWGPNLGWLFMWGSGGFNTSGDGSARRFLAVEAANADNRGDSEYPTNKSKLKQNLSAVPLAGGVWYDVKLHFDTSGAQGTYEAWVRQRGQSTWTKVSDWRGGQTANFFWPIPTDQRRGHTMFRWPTTVNGPGDSTVYLDDFKIAQTDAALN
jgi:hypothetical protein